MARARDAVLDTYDHRHVPFEMFLERLRPARSLEHHPLFQIAVVMHNASDEHGAPVYSGGAIHDLTWYAREVEGRIEGSFEFRSDLYAADTIDRIATHIETAMRVGVREPGRKISEFSLVTALERQKVLEESNTTAQQLDTSLYQARAERGPSNLPPLRKAYADFAISGRTRVGTEGWFRSQAEFWREALRDAPALLELPADRPRPPVASTLGARLHSRLDAEIISRLRGVARDEDVTLFMALLAVWQTLLARLSGQTDVIVGTPISTRDEEEYEKVGGRFINNVALRGDLSGEPTYREFLQRIKQKVLAAFRHAAFPFDMVVDTIKPHRSAAYAPIFQVLFTLLTSPARDDGDDIEETSATPFDLSLELSFTADGGMKAAYEYAVDLFDAAFIERLHRQFVLLLRAAGEDPSRSLMAASLVTPEEQNQICVGWNRTELAFDQKATVPFLIRKMARIAPMAIAVRSGEREIDYGVFDARVDALAQLLAERGAGPDERVAVALPRTTDLPVALAAVLRTGAAYIPIDPGHPFDRIASIVEDASPVCSVTVSEFAQLFDGLDCLCVDETEWDSDALPFDRPVDPGSPAYLIYTSGSTGKPKGVEVSHRNLVSFLSAMRVEPGIDAGDKLLAITTPSFDIAGLELWLPLTSGGCLVLADENDIVDGAALAELISQHDVKMMQATPTTWRLLLEDGWAGKRDLKALCGGEAMPLDLPQALLERVEALWNLYGPTETTVWSTAHRVSSADFGAARIPIGKPIANTRAYVLEPSGVVAPVGAPGELVIAGEGVALGYRNLEELTSERFVKMEIAGRKERVYRTGDRARWRSDGGLDFLGRSDGQVKVRGFRIELGEVEAALVSHPDIRQAYVAVSEGAGGTIVAYIVYEDAGAPTTSELRRHLRGRLPDYMLPSIFVGIESVPLSPHGKVDRRRLPDPFSYGRRANSNHEPLKPGMEQTIAEIWREYLKTNSVGPDDNFYELGGHSLLSLRVAAAVERRTGWRMDPRAMFFQTLREIAARAVSAEMGAHS